MKTLNELFSSLSTRRRYEVWFLRLGLADASGAWWFRYLLMNPGRGSCPHSIGAMPFQVWATWFPLNSKPQTFIQGFSLQDLDLSARGTSPFHLRLGENAIEENSCRGAIQVDGHNISWDLRYHSTFRITLSNKGWIGFSRSPHSDAVFSGSITFDGRTFSGDPLGFGVQGHNCGFRHRNFWTWGHAYFLRPGRTASTLEALVYEMPFGLVFRKAVLWHNGEPHIFRNLHETGTDSQQFVWNFDCSGKDGFQMRASFNGTGPGIHRLPYVRTDCSGSFEVTNNSLARARLRLEQRGQMIEELETNSGGVLEMVGR